MFLAIAPDAQLQPVGEGVYNGYTHTVQTTGHLIGIAVEFAARMQLRHNNFSGGHAFFFVDTHGNTAPVITDRNREIVVNCDVYRIRVTGQCLVNAVVHDLIDHMVQTRAVVSVPDVHAGALANSF